MIYCNRAENYVENRFCAPRNSDMTCTENGEGRNLNGPPSCGLRELLKELQSTVETTLKKKVSATFEPIWMKFCTDMMPLKVTSTPYYVIS
jgi:hypothetical protein